VDGRDCQAALKFLSFALYGDIKLSDGDVNPAPTPQDIKATNKCPRMSMSVAVGLKPPANDAERRKRVIDAYSHLASVHSTQGKVHISELLTLADSFLEHWEVNFQLAEIELVLLELQGSNKLMYDEKTRQNLLD